MIIGEYIIDDFWTKMRLVYIKNIFSENDKLWASVQIKKYNKDYELVFDWYLLPEYKLMCGKFLFSNVEYAKKSFDDFLNKLQNLKVFL